MIHQRKKKSQQIDILLNEKKYDKLENSYQYLVKMPMDMVNEENIAKLKNEHDSIKKDLEILESTSPIDIYYNELCNLEKSVHFDCFV